MNIIYHKNCMDGLAAAAAAKQVLGDAASYHPMQYGEALPDLGPGPVVFVDFCLKTIEDLRALAQDRWVLVIDHHPTAEAALSDTIDVSDHAWPWFLTIVAPAKGEVYSIYAKEKSGAVLAYEFFAAQPAPDIYLYVQDRDMWWWKQPRSREVSAALADRCLGVDAPLSAFYALPPIGTLVDEGSKILEFQGRVVSSAVKLGYLTDVVVDGETFRAAVTDSHIFQSEVGEALLAKYPEAQFAAIRFRGDASLIVSLRSRKDDVDVSKIAKRFGGGGHAAAAGFSVARGLLS